MRASETLRLGLIGDNIKASRAPQLHRLCGQLAGLDVSYDLFIPHQLGLGFDAVLDHCAGNRLVGVNVTLPYKENAIARAVIEDPVIRRIGAINTVLFGTSGHRGFNTDYTGFIAAFRAGFGDMAPGRVAMIGAGGVGRAIAYAALELGAEAITIVDTDQRKSDRLAAALRDEGRDTAVAVASLDAAIAAADGVVNATPIGMVGYPATLVAGDQLDGRRWVFDAVYTPIETALLREAGVRNLKTLSGYELFLHQGIDAFRIFSGRQPPELAELRLRLAAAGR